MRGGAASMFNIKSNLSYKKREKINLLAFIFFCLKSEFAYINHFDQIK